jgi:hypothetical protein
MPLKSYVVPSNLVRQEGVASAVLERRWGLIVSLHRLGEAPDTDCNSHVVQDGVVGHHPGGTIAVFVCAE